MKMVKSLLLGSAAGLVAVTAGQAADLPVKAKPVEYVKICSLYGAGFYYMPGTDMCIKIGGFVRAEITDYSNGNFTQGPQQADLNNRSTSNLTMRARGYITADAREQTAYGTARAYIAVGLSTADIGATLAYTSQSTNRAFIQWAGITAGQTQSFYDFYSAPAMGYRGYVPSSDTGDPGWWVWAYTAQLGNGVSASLSAEERRATQIVGISTGVGAGTAAAISNGASLVALTNTGGYGGMKSPDVVGNLRVDQTWGSAQVMAAAHNVDAPYYSSATVPFSGGPSDQWGFVVGAGLRLNFPMIAQGDYFQSQVNYSQGAMRYISNSNGDPNLGNENGNGVALGVMSDCVYGSTPNAAAPSTFGTGCNLTTGWGVNVGYEHYWTPQFHELFIGAYDAFRYNTQANNTLCVFEGGSVVPPPAGANAVATPGCNNNWDMWAAATRFQYNVTNSLYLGVEFLYTHYDTATSPTGLVGGPLATAFGGGVTATTPLKNENNLAITARIHKDFLP